MHTPSRSCFCRLARLSALTGSLFALGAASAHAQTYDVSLDTTGLTTGDSYALDLNLNQGDVTTPDSTVNVGSFLFGGGSPGPISSIVASGGATGSLSLPPVSLAVSAAGPVFSGLTQDFTRGSTLGFTVDATNLMTETGGTPDLFTFDLYDNSTRNPDGTTGALVTTDDNVTGRSFALFTLARGANGAYMTNNYAYTATGGALVRTVSAPSATPELGTVTSLGLLMGLFGLGVLRARRGQAQNAAGAE